MRRIINIILIFLLLTNPILAITIFEGLGSLGIILMTDEKDGDYIGNCFIIKQENDELTIVTAKHVIKDANKLTIILPGHMDFCDNCFIKIFEIGDSAIIVLKNVKQKYIYHPISIKIPQKGDEIKYISFLDGVLILRFGNIKQVGYESIGIGFYLTDVTCSLGMSGSIVLDKDNNIIGVLSHRQTSTRKMIFNSIIPISEYLRSINE